MRLWSINGLKAFNIVTRWKSKLISTTNFRSLCTYANWSICRSSNTGRDYGLSRESNASFADLPELVICSESTHYTWIEAMCNHPEYMGLTRYQLANPNISRKSLRRRNSRQ